MKKYKIVSATFQDGVSTVTISGYNGNYYTGVAKCHPDEVNPNEIFGGELAELRAIKQSMIDEKKEYEAKTAALRSYFKDVVGQVSHVTDPPIKILQTHIHRVAEKCVILDSAIKKIDKRQVEMVKARKRFLKNKYDIE